jgi:hemin uptake protein HemP
MSAADKPASASRDGEVQAAAIPAIDSKELFRGNRQVHILHAGQIYILRQTRDNKLILTK